MPKNRVVLVDELDRAGCDPFHARASSFSWPVDRTTRLFPFVFDIVDVIANQTFVPSVPFDLLFSLAPVVCLPSVLVPPRCCSRSW